MSTVFQLIADAHGGKFNNKEKNRLRAHKKLSVQQAYFRDTGIPEMWDEIKEIIIPNPVPETLEGGAICLASLMIPWSRDNIEQTGLELFWRDNTEVGWRVTDASCTDSDTPEFYYHTMGIKRNYSTPVTNKEAKQKIVTSFVRWASKLITPQMLQDFGFEPGPAATTKRARKILQLTET